MEVGGGQESVQTLLDALEGSRGDPTRLLAVLWTWLEHNPQKLGSLQDKYPLIIASTPKEEFEGLTDEVIAWVASDPLRNAAELLVRIDRSWRDPAWSEFDYSVGYDGTEVLVAWRVSGLVKRLSRDGLPAVAKEYPSPACLAPRLMVCPRWVNQIECEVLELDDMVSAETMRRFDAALAQEGDLSFSVHLDTLGDHGMSGLALDEKRKVGRFDPQEIEGEDEDHCVRAVKQAVEQASGPASMLVLPELAATPTVLEALADELRSSKEAPLFTVVGLYHLEPDDLPAPEALAGQTGWARYTNEAVVLGPSGEELWRHRKLTSASAEIEGETSDYTAVEDVILGDAMRIVPTPLGNVATVICLDAFADHGRERIAKSPGNLLLVPSLSRTVFRHRVSLQHLVQRLWGVAFVCNRWTVSGSWNTEPCRSFWAIQRRSIVVPQAKEEGEHPSFVFKLSESKRATEDPDEV